MRATDLLVVGAGHAGSEAALAAARLGLNVDLVTLRADGVAFMPCNPAMGGVGKGHLLAELDALGGVQAWAADRSGLQFRVLNASRGMAVRGPRVQCDKGRHSAAVGALVRGVRGIRLVIGEATGLLSDDRGIRGVTLADGRRLHADRVLLTTGTFLGGLLHTGENVTPGGRVGEKPSLGLGAALAGLGLELIRFKTGTPPRLDRSSIDFDQLTRQDGDPDPQPLSWRTRSVRNKACCWTTRTNPEVQDIVRENLHRSPLYSGRIEGVGPRYCPSIEDKVVRFPHHDRHALFLEPETMVGDSIYVNGLSTSLPEDVQRRLVATIPGLEEARFLRFGYAVEYDVVPAIQLGRDLQVRAVPGLYLAGQLIGTSGYEEAGALGLLAGVNAAMAQRGEKPFVIPREQGYMGVLVDDLVSRKHKEPYRMFTSRTEFRLLLGTDTARERLMPIGNALGLVPDRMFHVEQAKWERVRSVERRLEGAKTLPGREMRARVQAKIDQDFTHPTTLAGLLRRPEVCAQRFAALDPDYASLSPQEREVVASRVRYAGYLDRQHRDLERVRRLRGFALPREASFYEGIGLSNEVRELLRENRPPDLAAAERLAGMTPSALALIAARLERGAS